MNDPFPPNIKYPHTKPWFIYIVLECIGSIHDLGVPHGGKSILDT